MSRKLITLAFFTFLFTTILKAQSDAENKIKTQVWTNVPSEFKETQIPDKWKNESAVIIATSLDYSDNHSKSYVEVVSHNRIKLIDKAAVKEYSELTFNSKYVSSNLFGKANSYFIIAVKIIKPDGTEKEIDLTKAVKTDSDSKKGFKIAVPDLEPGDIIDYFSAAREQTLAGSQGGVSDNLLIEAEYPIMKRTVRLQFSDQFLLETHLYNGAPDFKKRFDDPSHTVIYELEDNMRDKSSDILWTYDHRSAPEIRFRKQNRSTYTDTPIQQGLDYLASYSHNNADIGIIEDYMKANMKKDASQAQIVNELYYLLRNPIYLQACFNIEQGHPLSIADVDYNNYFQLVSKYLLKNNISHNILLIPSVKYGDLQEMVDLNYTDLVIRVNSNPPIFIPRVSPFAIPNEISSDYEGMICTLSPVLPKNGVQIFENSIPKSTTDNNITTVTFDVNLNADDNSKIDVKRSVVAKGHNKEAHQYLVVTDYDYLKEYDLPKYQAESSHLIGGLLKQYNKEKEKYEQRLTQDYNERDKKLKDDIESSMNVKVAEYKNFKLKTIGMWDYAPNTEYTDEFTIENLTKKAGPNYILELAKLIEKQTEITDKQRTRDRDIYMNNARKFVNVINFTIPEGYTVEGLENLNKEVKNSTGGFKCTAVVEGNTLKITTEKYYSGNYFEAKDWPKMVEFLDAAVAFTNAKVLLKKK